MNIVIFGMDNSGKTTLGNNLKNYLDDIYPATYVHSLGNVPLDDMIKFIETELLPPGAEQFKIFDRFPIIEEEVYGRLLRGESKFDNLEVGYKEKQLAKIDLFIYCDPGFDSITNWQGREQMDGVIDNAKKLYKAYNKLVKELTKKNYNIKTYNFNTDDFRTLLEMPEWIQ